MTSIKQVERIIRILQQLALKRDVTVNQLYQMFEKKVPKRTLQRDLYELSAADIPLVDRPGEGRELIWSMDRSFASFIPETIGSRELLVSHFMERLATVTKGTVLESNIRSLLAKARQLIAPEVFRSIDGDRMSPESFGVTFMGYIDYAPHSETIDRLVRAVSERRRCHFTYKAVWREEPSEFDAEPYLLLYHKGALYAVVYVPAHDNYIFLPVQRIRIVSVLDETFVRKPEFSLDTLREGRFGIYGGEDLKPERVVLRFRKEIADVVAERIWHPSQKMTHNKDGSLTFELKTIVSDELRAWIGSWLEHVEVLEPDHLRRVK